MRPADLARQRNSAVEMFGREFGEHDFRRLHASFPAVSSFDRTVGEEDRPDDAWQAVSSVAGRTGTRILCRRLGRRKVYVSKPEPKLCAKGP
jgi:hypothetical protein